MSEKALVVFSGGQDSTTCLLWALDKFGQGNVECLGFNYGQKHTVELEQAKKIANKLLVPYKVIDISFMNEISVSNLVSESEGDVNDKHPLNENLPSSFVPFRNMIFATIASAYALKIGAKNIVLGVNAIDYSGYPDCRPEFYEALQVALKKAVDSELMEVNIYTPLMYLDKAQIFKLADDLGGLDIVVNDSHTCYNGDHEHKHPWGYGCDSCPSCKLRKEGFNKFKENEITYEKEKVNQKF